MRGPGAFAVLALLTAAACHTDIALVDDSFGYEQVHAGRVIHLRNVRVPLVTATDGRLRFALDFTLENASDEPWVVCIAAFAVGPVTAAEYAPAATIELPTDAVLVTVAAHADADVKLPIVLTLAQDTTSYDTERVPLLLTFTDGGIEMLRRRVVVGSYSGVGQVIRVVGLVTGGLLLFALL